MVRTQISLTEEQHTALLELAHARKTSMSALIRLAVDDLVRLSGTTAAEELLKFSDAFAAPMGGKHHDDILAEGPW
jgi:hypothetical protein